MEAQQENRRREQEAPDIGVSILAGAFVVLALYGGYKLYQQEKQEQRSLGGGHSEVLDKLFDQELK